MDREQRGRGAVEKSIQNSKFKIKELLPPLSQ
jgi:hypothetical protein